MKNGKITISRHKPSTQFELNLICVCRRRRATVRASHLPFVSIILEAMPKCSFRIVKMCADVVDSPVTMATVTGDPKTYLKAPTQVSVCSRPRRVISPGEPIKQSLSFVILDIGLRVCPGICPATRQLTRLSAPRSSRLPRSDRPIASSWPRNWRDLAFPCEQRQHLPLYQSFGLFRLWRRQFDLP